MLRHYLEHALKLGLSTIKGVQKKSERGETGREERRSGSGWRCDSDQLCRGKNMLARVATHDFLYDNHHNGDRGDHVTLGTLHLGLGTVNSKGV